MAQQSYFNLILDTIAPSCTLSLGTNGFIGSLNGTLGISCEDADIFEMKIWGVMGTRSADFIGDGSTTDFSITSKPVELTVVSVDGVSSTDYSYDAETGTLSFTSAPGTDSGIVVQWKELLTEGTANWEAFAETKLITLQSGDGAKTVFAKVRDDVYNESEVAEVTVVLDMTAPVVSIISGPTPNKISKVYGKNVSQFTFQVSENFVEFKVAVVANSAISEAAAVVIGTDNGSTNMSGTGAFEAGNAITCTITGADLEAASSGDGTKLIKVFVKDASGNWSL